MTVNTAGAGEFVIYREEKIGLTFANIFIHTRIILKYIYRGQSSTQIYGYCEKKMTWTALGGTLRNCAFLTAQAKAILELHLLHTQWSPACPCSQMQLFHRQAAYWMAKDKGPNSASRVRAGLREADRSSAAQGVFWLGPTPFCRIPKIALIKSSRLTGSTLLHIMTATVPAKLPTPVSLLKLKRLKI